jgi:Family of unknown function (DUF5709)
MSDADELYGDSVYEGGDAVDDGDVYDQTDDLGGADPDELGDEGYNPPNREPYRMRHFPTEAEDRAGESLADHLAEEEPEVWDNDADDLPVEARAGRLVGTDAGSGPVDDDDIAIDAGRAGNAASAEEAAVHVIDDEQA